MGTSPDVSPDVSPDEPPRAGDPPVLRRPNSAATLRALRGGGERTLTELASQVGLSRPTTEVALSELTAKGLVEEVAPEAGRRLGRPARRYRFRAEAGFALGIEINAHRTLVRVADLDGRVVGGEQADLEIGLGPRDRLAAVRGVVRAGLAEAGVPASRLWAVAVGTPGVIDAGGRVAICTVVPDWQGVHLTRELGRPFSCPVLAENDANLAAVAERWRGAAQDVDDMVYVLAGLHTGAGAVIGGRLHRGRFGAAGEVGTLPELGLRDTAAELAGTEPAGTEPAGAELAGTEPAGTEPAGAGESAGPRGRADRAAAKVLAAAGAGDPAALARVDHVAGRMARGVAAMVLAFDPEMVIVGGALTLAGGVLVGELRRHVLPLCLGPTRIEASALGDESVGLGAVRLALDRIEDGLLLRRGSSPR